MCMGHSFTVKVHVICNRTTVLVLSLPQDFYVAKFSAQIFMVLSVYLSLTILLSSSFQLFLYEIAESTLKK